MNSVLTFVQMHIFNNAKKNIKKKQVKKINDIKNFPDVAACRIVNVKAAQEAYFINTINVNGRFTNSDLYFSLFDNSFFYDPSCQDIEMIKHQKHQSFSHKSFIITNKSILTL